MSIKSNWSTVLLKTTVSSLIFCVDHLSIQVGGVLKSPIIVVLLSVSPFISVNICFIFRCPLLGAFRLTSVISSFIDPFIIIWCSSLSFVTVFVLLSVLSDMNITTPAFLHEIPFMSLHFQSGKYNF